MPGAIIAEELFVVLDGEGVCLLQAAGEKGWQPEEHPLRRGSIVSLPAGTGVAHGVLAGPPASPTSPTAYSGRTTCAGTPIRGRCGSRGAA